MAIAAIVGLALLMCLTASTEKNPATVGDSGVQFIAIAPFFPIDATQRITYNRINATHYKESTQ